MVGLVGGSGRTVFGSKIQDDALAHTADTKTWLKSGFEWAAIFFDSLPAFFRVATAFAQHSTRQQFPRKFDFTFLACYGVE